MLNWLMNGQLDSLERRLDAVVNSLRHVVRTFKVAFIECMEFEPLAAHRDITSHDPQFVAWFLATLPQPARSELGVLSWSKWQERTDAESQAETVLTAGGKS